MGGTSGPSGLQQDAFYERLARIEAQTGPVTPRKVRPKRAQRRAKAQAASPIEAAPVPKRRAGLSGFGLLLALISGLAAVVAARYVRFQYLESSVDEDMANFGLVVDSGVALAICLVIGVLLRLRGPVALIAQTSAIAFMIVAMHNVIHWLPEESAQALPPAYVAAVLAETEPNTLRLKDQVLPFPGLVPVVSPESAPAEESAAPG